MPTKPSIGHDHDKDIVSNKQTKTILKRGGGAEKFPEMNAFVIFKYEQNANRRYILETKGECTKWKKNKIDSAFGKPSSDLHSDSVAFDDIKIFFLAWKYK